MRNIISRYLAREVLKTSAATLLVLFVILLSNALGRVLADVADGDVPQQALWPVMLSQSVAILSLLLPIGLFLGIVFAFGRMYKDHEVVVMLACGVGYRDFYLPVLAVTLPLCALSAYTTIWLNAAVQLYAEEIVNVENNRNEFQQIKPGQFNQSSDGDLVFYMESLSEDRLELRDIIISQTLADRMVLETAESGRQRIDEKTGDLFLVVGPGQRHEGIAGQGDFNIIEFEQHGILIENRPDDDEFRLDADQKTPAQLWASTRARDQAELHWRIAIPVALLVLALLAVPLSYIAPRHGRFGKVAWALLAYIVYMNLIGVTRAQLETGNLPMVINYWWVHALFVALTVFLLYRRNHGVLLARASA